MSLSGWIRTLRYMSSSRRAANSKGRHDPTHAARAQRDAGLERGRTITKGMAFGSVAAVVIGGVYFSQAIPGHAATTRSSNGVAGAVAPAPAAAPQSQGDDSDDSNQSGDSGYSDDSGYANQAPAPAAAAPAAPVYVPAPAYTRAPVVSSGGS